MYIKKKKNTHTRRQILKTSVYLQRSLLIFHLFKFFDQIRNSIPTSKGNKQTRKENISKSNHIIATPRIRKTRKSQKHRNCFTTGLVTTSNLERKLITSGHLFSVINLRSENEKEKRISKYL